MLVLPSHCPLQWGFEEFNLGVATHVLRYSLEILRAARNFDPTQVHPQTDTAGAGGVGC